MNIPVKAAMKILGRVHDNINVLRIFYRFEIGPDGNYYVSSLPGFPESPGAGSVFRIDRSSGSVTQIATGFTGATDLAVAEPPLW